MQVLANAVGRNRFAAEQLLPQVYADLQRLARARLRNASAAGMLQATELVHEAYLRLVQPSDPGWDGYSHFFGAAAHAMRDILVEQARRGAAAKRGAGWARIALDTAEPVYREPADEILAVDEALQRLEAEDPRKGRIANLRYFAGMTTAETAKMLGISIGTVGREWLSIRHWLQDRLRDS